MTTAEVATIAGCTPQYIRMQSKKAKTKNQSIITVKGQSFGFVEVHDERGISYEFTPVEEMGKPRRTVSKKMSFAHLEELDAFDLTATKHSKAEKLLLMTFMRKHNYTLKIIIESLLARDSVISDKKQIASITRKIQRWKSSFETKGAKALEDKRGKTRATFLKIDEELLITAIEGAGARGIRENYYGVWDFYCYAWQKKNSDTFTTKNEEIISYSALTAGIKKVFRLHPIVHDYWKKGEDALLQSYPVGQKDIRYPNHEWQVDATKFDFMCHYTDASGNPKIGRLNLTATIDVYTGNAVATLSETINSYDQVRVIYKAFERMGTPEQIYTDNGKDYVSYHYSDVLLDLGITQITAQVGQGRQKGKIERFFGVFQTELAKLPGYIGNNVAKRTRIENQTASKIDVRTGKATRIATHRIMTVEEWQTVVDNICAKSAENYKDQESNLLNTSKLEDIRRQLGKKSTRPLHDDGIKLNSYTYTSASLWVGGLTKGNRVEVYEDIDNINRIYVYHEGSYIGEALNRDLGVEVMSLEEHKAAKKANHKNLIAPAQKSIKQAKELYEEYEDHNAKEILEMIPEYAKPAEEPISEPKPKANSELMDFVLNQA